MRNKIFLVLSIICCLLFNYSCVGERDSLGIAVTSERLSRYTFNSPTVSISPDLKKFVYRIEYNQPAVESGGKDDYQFIVKDLDTNKLSLFKKNFITFFPDGDVLRRSDYDFKKEEYTYYKENFYDSKKSEKLNLTTLRIDNITFSSDGEFMSFVIKSGLTYGRDDIAIFDIKNNKIVKKILGTNKIFDSYYNSFDKKIYYMFNINPIISKDSRKIFFLDTSSKYMYIIDIEKEEIEKIEIKDDSEVLGVRYINYNNNLFYFLLSSDKKIKLFIKNIDNAGKIELKIDFPLISKGFIDIVNNKILYSSFIDIKVGGYLEYITEYYLIDFDGNNKTKIFSSDEQKDPKNFTKDKIITFDTRS